MSVLKGIKVGDYITIRPNNQKPRIAKLLKDVKLRIISIERDDPTVMVGEYNGVKYQIFVENIKELFRRPENFVLS